MNVRSLRLRLGLLFFAFSALVVAAVAMTYAVVAGQRHDALLINLAGRQRMLSQQMTWLALAAPDDPLLAANRRRFAETLTALEHGGSALAPSGQGVELPPPDDPAVRAALAEAREAWLRFDAELARVASGEADALLATASLVLLDALDRVVAQLAAQAEAKVQRLQIIQAGFLLVALLLLGIGYRVVQRRVVNPLAALGAAAARMAAGDLQTQAPTFVEDELHRLSTAFDALRAEVLTSQQQLEARVRQRTQELLTAFEFSQEIAAQLELERLLRSVTDRARALMAGDAAALCLLDRDAAVLQLAVGSGAGEANLQLHQPVNAALPRQVIGEGRTVVTETACASCGFLRSMPGGQCIATPLRAGEATLGALCVVRPAKVNFEPEEQAALALLANAAAVAIVNARLVEQGRAQAQQSAIQSERERLAAELHDNLAQTLSFLNLKTDQLENAIVHDAENEAVQLLAEMRGATLRAYSQVRAALAGLQAGPRATAALATDLHDCVVEMQALTGLTIELTIEDADALRLTPLAHQQALHIVREALTNAWRHAQVRQVSVRVQRIADAVHLTVRDEGCGFDPMAVDDSGHLGLTIMRARAERSGGALDVHAQPNAGTTIVATFPLHKERCDEPVALVAGRRP
ncbi:MAG: type IV pili methyl-accepting chemotaxis transducer N-terminal domain-containing protein [Caldilinea sp.]|nr:type IV pili methyl-accepting chemotaxis transducer N-terminal domain-containing protein [Caldilinea sp.]MDW8439292.1 type IV pili methyl-accepting chemotaxis transducer N-terminal domain-containing protein [Caldilineaceae bacterium]